MEKSKDLGVVEKVNIIRLTAEGISEMGGENVNRTEDEDEEMHGTNDKPNETGLTGDSDALFNKDIID